MVEVSAAQRTTSQARQFIGAAAFQVAFVGALGGGEPTEHGFRHGTWSLWGGSQVGA